MFSTKNPLCGPIKLIIHTARTLNTINQCLERELGGPGRAVCYASRIHNHQLTLMVADGHSMTWIKYQEQSILSHINALPGLPNITRIRYKVSPHLKVPDHPPTAKPFERSVSLAPNRLYALKQSADNIKHPKLKNALGRLLETISHLAKTQ